MSRKNISLGSRKLSGNTPRQQLILIAILPDLKNGDSYGVQHKTY
jgi:hypothetical protein